MYILKLNDMRSSQVETLTTVARADTKEELEALMDREKVESYRDDNWWKTYRKGGPLEWFNPPCGPYEFIVNVGTQEDWEARARLTFAHLTNIITKVEEL